MLDKLIGKIKSLEKYTSLAVRRYLLSILPGFLLKKCFS